MSRRKVSTATGAGLPVDLARLPKRNLTVGVGEGEGGGSGIDSRIGDREVD